LAQGRNVDFFCDVIFFAVTGVARLMIIT